MRRHRRQCHHLGSRPPTRFLVATVFKGGQLAIVAEQQRSDASWSMELVGPQCQGRGAQLVKVDRDLAHRLHGVDMQRDFVFAARF